MSKNATPGVRFPQIERASRFARFVQSGTFRTDRQAPYDAGSLVGLVAFGH